MFPTAVTAAYCNFVSPKREKDMVDYWVYYMLSYSSFVSEILISYTKAYYFVLIFYDFYSTGNVMSLR